jgi:hypothetical protein
MAKPMQWVFWAVAVAEMMGLPAAELPYQTLIQMVELHLKYIILLNRQPCSYLVPVQSASRHLRKNLGKNNNGPEASILGR